GGGREGGGGARLRHGDGEGSARRRVRVGRRDRRRGRAAAVAAVEPRRCAAAAAGGRAAPLIARPADRGRRCLVEETAAVLRRANGQVSLTCAAPPTVASIMRSRLRRVAQ